MAVEILVEDPTEAVLTSESTEYAERITGPIERATAERLLGAVTVTDGGREFYPVTSPLDGSALGEVPRCTAEDVAEAVRRARGAQESWRELPFRRRAEVLVRFHDLVLDRRVEVLDLIQRESGKARVSAYEEVADAAIVARYYAHAAEEHLRTRRRQGVIPGLTSAWEHRHPVGVVGIIAPWNYPLSLAVTDALPALMAGNGVVLKPDRQTPWTALWAVDLLFRAGLPRELLRVVTGEGAVLGTPLIEQVDFVTFTGSTRTGRIVARQAAERLIGCALELGGKNPALVLADANLDRAAEGVVRGAFASAGQLCMAMERIYIQRAIWDDFVPRLVERTAALRLGAGLEFGLDVGSLVSEGQLRTVTAHVDDAVTKGAEVLVGGQARPELGPFFFEPTLLAGVTEEMTLCREETFGPVAALYPFDTVDEAVARANDTRYGLNASLWSGDEARARRIARRLQAGTVNINEAYAAAWGSVDAPMGGFKDSGLGRRHGDEGILKYTEAQTVAAQRGLPLAPPPGVTDEGFSQILSQALRVLRRLPGLR